MVVNLCLPPFKTTARCNKLCADGFDVSNLLSGDPVARRSGFRLEYFLRPPLQVTLHFQVRVELCRVDVELWPCGMDKGSSSRRLEVLTCPDLHSKASECEENGQFKLVGRCELKEEVLVCFRHPNFHYRAPFSAPPPEPAACGMQQELWSRGPQSLSSVGQLRISVPYGGAASALGIKSLAVWGVPARCCSSSEVEKIQRAHLDSLIQEPSALPVPVSVSDISPMPKPEPSEMTIPEEFLDPLTLELMVLPMILPSGMVVDSSTLEEYQKQEATWGRLPNDPFTGVPFTKDSKPLPNPHLKSRIDSLRLKTGCTGVSSTNSLLNKPQPSRLVMLSKPERPTCSIDSINVQSSQAGPSGMENWQVRSTGCKNIEEQQNQTIKKHQNLSRISDPKVQYRSCVEGRGFILGSVSETHNIRRNTVGHSNKRKHQSNLSSPNANSATYSPFSTKMPRTDASLALPTETHSSEASHEQRLSDSLEQALSSALCGLPTYTSQSTLESDTRAGSTQRQRKRG